MKFNKIINSIKETLNRYMNSIPDADRKKIVGYMYIILTLMTVSFFGLFAIAPTLSTISNLNRQYKDNLLIYEALNKKLSNLQLLDFQYGTIQSDLPLLYSTTPETPQIPVLTRQIEDLANQNGVSLVGLNFGSIELFPNSKDDPIYSFSFLISAEGTQENINRFMADVINFDRIIGIDRIATGANEDNRYRAEITGRAYFSNK